MMNCEQFYKFLLWNLHVDTNVCSYLMIYSVVHVEKIHHILIISILQFPFASVSAMQPDNSIRTFLPGYIILIKAITSSILKKVYHAFNCYKKTCCGNISYHSACKWQSFHSGFSCFSVYNTHFTDSSMWVTSSNFQVNK